MTRPFRILVVCDPKDARDFRSIFDEATSAAHPDWQVDFSPGDDDTFLVVEALRPDAVVVSSVLEEGDAAAFISALRESPGGERVHVVLVGDEFGSYRHRNDADGVRFDVFVPPPLTGGALIAAVVPAAARASTIVPASSTNAFLRREPTEEIKPERSASEPLLVHAASSPSTSSQSPRLTTVTAEDIFDDIAEASSELSSVTKPGRPKSTGSGVATTSDRPSPIADTRTTTQHRANSPVAIDMEGKFGDRLREKMAEMSRRLFQDPAPVAEVRSVPSPRERMSTDVDFDAIDRAVSLEGRVAPNEIHAHVERRNGREVAAASMETGAITVGMSDAASLCARLWQRDFTGQLTLMASADGFAGARLTGANQAGTNPHEQEAQYQLFFQGGRIIFAASTSASLRLGQMLQREGKVTAEEVAASWDIASRSGRRVGEVLVERGLLKRRELMPAIRRQLESIIFRAFGQLEGKYVIVPEVETSERVQLTRHTVSLVAEGLRRKWNRSFAQRAFGSDDTQFEVGNRARMRELMTSADLDPDDVETLAGLAERRTVGEFGANPDEADLLPLIWLGGILSAVTIHRRSNDDEFFVSESDLAVDRERIRRRLRVVSHGNYFAILGLERSATRFEVKRAYQATSREFAAESFPSVIRSEMARELATIGRSVEDAYRVLIDDALREAYARTA